MCQRNKLKISTAIHTKVLKESRHNIHHHIEKDEDVNIRYQVLRTHPKTARSKIKKNVMSTDQNHTSMLLQILPFDLAFALINYHRIKFV